MADHYHIYSSHSSGGTIKPEGTATLPVGGESQIYTFGADSGYRRLNTLVDGLTVGNPDEIQFEDVQDHHSIYAEYTLDQFLLTINVPKVTRYGSLVTPGTVIPNPPGWYANGAQPGLVAVPYSGFSFGSWSGALTGASPSGTVVMTDNRTVNAHFV